MTKAKALELLEIYLSSAYSYEETAGRLEINEVRQYIIDNLK